MILGIGNDLIEINRVRKIIEGKAGRKFLERVLTREEQNLAKGRQSKIAEFTAGRFAAKEAIVKALGCGIGKEFSFQDVEILPDPLGKPVCSLAKEAVIRRGLETNLKVHLSITHSQTMASSFAVIEQV